MEVTEHPVSVPARRRTSDAGAAPQGNANTFIYKVNKLLYDMDTLGIVTQMMGKVVGGVIMLPSVYELEMHTEGKEVEMPPCKLLFSRMAEGSLLLIPATQEDIDESDQLPNEAPLLQQLLSSAAVNTFKWSKVPTVAVLGCITPSAEELAQAEACGLPVSSSCTGPYEAALMTQLEVFFKNKKYPDNKCFILRDRGFAIFSGSLDEAIATFDATIRKCFTSGTCTPATEPPAKRAFSGLTSAFKRLGSKVQKDTPKDGALPLAQHQTTPLDTVPEPLPFVRAVSLPGPPGTKSAGPMSPSAAGSLTLGSGLSRSAVGSPGGSGDVQLPDDIRYGNKNARASSNDSYTIPSFQTGLRPW